MDGNCEAFQFYGLQLLHFYGQGFITNGCQLHYAKNYGQSAPTKPEKSKNGSADYSKPPKIRVADTPMVAPRAVVDFCPYMPLWKKQVTV